MRGDQDYKRVLLKLAPPCSCPAPYPTDGWGCRRDDNHDDDDEDWQAREILERLQRLGYGAMAWDLVVTGREGAKRLDKLGKAFEVVAARQKQVGPTGRSYWILVDILLGLG
jgi:hypothetical protein